jgi:hypothetical protein
MIQKIHGQSEPGVRARTLIVTLCMTACVIWLYRLQILNGFTLLAGDRYDGAISTTILEHWYKVFRGKANWAEVNYLFPHLRSIANTDGYFLIGVAYAPFRFLGCDPFLASELTNIVIKCIGFVGMYWMSRRVFSLPFRWALLAAILFTLSNGMTSHSSRSQLSAVALTPFMVLLLWNAAQAVNMKDFGKARILGAAAGLLFGALCLTCFYVAWLDGGSRATYQTRCFVSSGVHRFSAFAGTVSICLLSEVAGNRCAKLCRVIGVHRAARKYSSTRHR